MANIGAKLPTVYITHGGGPMPLLGDQRQASLIAFLKKANKLWPTPKAILIATAHWEENVATVSVAPKPGMLYDYYGFPAEAYEIKYDAPGSPDIAQRVLTLLRKANVPCQQDAQRGYDHGTFVPLKMMYPEADIPVVQMSVLHSMEPQAHLDIGKALAPLREEGVLIVGSGSSFHNMGAFKTYFSSISGGEKVLGEDFDQWLQTTLTKKGPEDRAELLRHWAEAPGGRLAHPREEHLIPLMVAVGAAGDDSGTAIYQGHVMGAAMSGYGFGM